MAERQGPGPAVLHGLLAQETTSFGRRRALEPACCDTLLVVLSFDTLRILSYLLNSLEYLEFRSVCGMRKDQHPSAHAANRILDRPLCFLLDSLGRNSVFQAHFLISFASEDELLSSVQRSEDEGGIRDFQVTRQG